jgi:hypothetical protein
MIDPSGNFINFLQIENYLHLQVKTLTESVFQHIQTIMKSRWLIGSFVGFILLKEASCIFKLNSLFFKGDMKIIVKRFAYWMFESPSFLNISIYQGFCRNQE